MNIKKKLNIALGGILTSLLIFASPSLLAEKQGHDDHSEHKEKPTEHNEDKHDDMKDDHANKKDDDGHGHEKKPDDDGHGHEEKPDDDGHGHEEKSAGHDEEEEDADVELSKDQMEKAGIETMTLKSRSVSNQISALSEVKLNQYKTINVSSSLTTRIEKRHVRMGDFVKKGDLLITLHTISTPDMSANLSADKLSRADLNASITTTIAEMEASIAEAKGELAAATATWDRVRSLGRDAVSGKRYVAAKIAREQAAGKLKAYQKSRSKIKRLGKPKQAKNFVKEHYELRAEQSGMVIQDDFILGQIVNPEDVLLVISDMDHLWVEANIKPSQASKIFIGSSATIESNGKHMSGKVIFIGRILNEKTRTLPVRIEVLTSDSSLFPGQFVKTKISSKATHNALVVPSEAVLRSSDGDWMLFVEETKGQFIPKEIEIIENLGNTVVIKGIEEGVTIVSKGAFFVQSELAKSGFSVHNH